MKHLQIALENLYTKNLTKDVAKNLIESLAVDVDYQTNDVSKRRAVTLHLVENIELFNCSLALKEFIIEQFPKFETFVLVESNPLKYEGYSLNKSTLAQGYPLANIIQESVTMGFLVPHTAHMNADCSISSKFNLIK